MGQLNISEKEVAEQFGFLLSQELLKAAPKNTGNLARSFPGTLKVDGNVISFILPKYAEYIEFGTQPYVIRPKNKKALAFKKDGKTIFAKKINHPGIKMNPFIRNTVYGKSDEIMQRVLDRLNK